MQKTIRGQTIVLEAETGLPDGQRVEVVIRPIAEPNGPRERLAALGGSLADLPAEEWEALDEIVRDRAQGSKRDNPD
jgi:hypothetical protein